MYHLEKRKRRKGSSSVITNARAPSTRGDRAQLLYLSLMLSISFSSFDPMWKKWSGRRSVSLTCLKCLSHLILDSSEKCSPGWKDEAIQNGNIYYPPSQHSFCLFLSVWVNYGELPSEMSSCFTKKTRQAASCFLPSAWKMALNDITDSVLI